MRVTFNAGQYMTQNHLCGVWQEAVVVLYGGNFAVADKDKIGIFPGTSIHVSSYNDSHQQILIPHEAFLSYLNGLELVQQAIFVGAN